MAKIGKKTKRGVCRCTGRTGFVFHSRRYKDSKGEYILCPNCKARHRGR